MTAGRRVGRKLSIIGLSAGFALASALFGAGCGSSASGIPADATSAANPQTGRPSTTAILQIVAPAPNAQTGPDVDVTMRLANARLVPPTQVGGKLYGDQGHIHLSLDGQLIAMPLRLDEQLPSLSAGPHTVEAEFVASDHLPFANRVVAAVSFTVR